MKDKKVKSEIISLENGGKCLAVTMSGREFRLPFKLIAGRMVGFLDISGQVDLIEAAADELVELLYKSGASFDTILNPVSKSNALAHAIALRWNKLTGSQITRTVVARKSSTPSKISASYRSVTTPNEQVLSITDDDAEFIAGKNILLLDDVYGGGGTTAALMELAQKATANVTAHAVVGAEGGKTLPESLFFLFTLPVLDA